ncbi:MAG: hypothetical protein DWP95_12690 [Proteobacteria bacterium]|nr:MAG: hypothetical protein DWP95_12690 [Pseudomonadota bacterium]
MSSAGFFNGVKKEGKRDTRWMAVGELCKRFRILLSRHTYFHVGEPKPDSSNTLRTGDEMGAVFAQQKKCPLSAVVRAAGFFNGVKKEGKRDTLYV